MYAMWLKKLKFLDAPYIIEILKDGISFRKIKSSISWSLYYLIKYMFIISNY